MAKLSNSDSRRMYSWWWDSHISPKNSRWLQENLTDIDVKVKSMIKLIEEDADSFAKRADMYYKKRPELMKMVEEFYRAYRALAERYDHATGVIRHAHRTMSEHFPNQDQMMFPDDSPPSSAPDMSTPMGEFTDESDSVSRRKPAKAFNEVRRGLNFDEVDEEENDSEDILSLKKAIAELEAEKEAGLVQYQQSSDKLAQLEAEITKTREDFKLLTDHASKADDEVVVLKEALSKFEAERESKFQEYKQCLDRISDLETTVSTAEVEAQSLKNELDKLALEKDLALDQYMQSLGTISKLENNLEVSKEDAMRLKEKAEKAEGEIEILRQNVSKLTKEKEAAALQYKQCLETISSLEEKCLVLERANQSFHSEIESLTLKMGNQSHELTEKQKELGRLWACVQEERLRFVEAETAFQTLQHLHAQTQEELRAMGSELQNRAHLMKVFESRNQSLQDEVRKYEEENKHLNELNESSALSIKDMQNEIYSLTESKGKLVEEVELRLDERNALQQEIYSLKEELNGLNQKHLSVSDEVKQLQDENSCLKDTSQRESIEKAALLQKLVILEQLLEKNSILEMSLSDLNAELEAVRGKMEALEQSCRSLMEEKSTLVAELKATNENLEKLSENNTVLESSLSKAQHQLEALKAKSKILEDSCQLLVNEKAGLITENDGLISRLENTQTRLEELEGRCFDLEREKESTLRKVEELKMSLELERQEHGNYVQTSDTRFSGVEAEMLVLEDKAMSNEIEILVLRNTARLLKENSNSMLVKNQKLLHESSLSETKILQLEKKSSEQQFEINSLSDQASVLRAGIFRLLKVLGLCDDSSCEDNATKDQVYFKQLLTKLQSMKNSIRKAEEENLEQCVELSVLFTLINQLSTDSKILKVEKTKIEHALLARIEGLSEKLMYTQGVCQILEREKLANSDEKSSLTDNIVHLEEKNNVLEEENYVLCDKVLALENLSLLFQCFADEKLTALRELGSDRNKLCEMNAALMEKLTSTEARLEESKIENLDHKDKLQKTDNEFKVVASVRDQLSDEMKNTKEALHQMAIKLQEAEEKISLVEKQKLELSEDNGDLKTENTFLREASQKLEFNLHELQGEHDKRKIQEENLQFELQSKINEINELEKRAALVFGELQYSMVSQLLYEQKYNELRNECFGYIGQNKGLKSQLAAYGPEIASLKECISSLENHTDIHIKFQNPENKEFQGAEVESISDLRDLRVRLQAIVKSAVEIKEIMVNENIDLHSKLEASARQIELLQQQSDDGGRYRRPHRATSEISEADNVLLTKDIVLDQISDSKRQPADVDNQIVESWETSDPDGTIGLTVGKSKKTFDRNDFRRSISMKKQKDRLLLEKDSSTEKIKPLQEVKNNKKKVLERLDSDVQKLANLQITVQDLKRKLEVTEKGKRGKAVLECESLKGQLDEADVAVMKMFDLNGRLMKSVDDRSFSDSKSSFDFEGEEGNTRRRVSEQARRMSEKIGRLQLEVQRLQFVLMKLDDERENGKAKMAEMKRRILLRDYLYGGGRTGQRRKKGNFCACAQPSVVED
ncbi:hypothetical protein ABFS82_04G032200 [Erythranthe guttata]|uniref:protein NETWORKED 1D n=1 Tax=Erythranthe guttata TaxID=4155 RepID=UPI00064E0A6A|nr:PREDICTED: protein NETWORKED 1D [Erythranthe guttata]XP_012832086.1 PREDICTED: protein NETWORKED 1D [Erythranthe guttata]XP_012832093.1 PREDICTED: protein NETWORKED 1D [Erythranthe guttata]|eukprot:XP_012832079.1 PREDICTED: protein NETWORKED 1D [Erythranthe guttata]